MNAKVEFLQHIGNKEVLCACCYLGPSYDEIVSRIDMETGSDLNTFLERLNFEYDDGYGRQELDGTIWYKDGTYSERAEYDGSEWWEHRAVPQIPERLLSRKNNA
jgi:hypothetical protein